MVRAAHIGQLVSLNGCSVHNGEFAASASLSRGSVDAAREPIEDSILGLLVR